MPYVMGVAGFAVIFLIIVVLFGLYFGIGQCVSCCCPCMWAKKSGKTNWKEAISHIISAVLCLVGIILFFLASSYIVNGLGEANKIPGAVNNTFVTILDIVESTIKYTFDVIDTSVANVSTTVDEFVGKFNDNIAGVKASLQATITSINNDKTTFADHVQTPLNSFQTKIDSATCGGQPITGIELTSSINSAMDQFTQITNSMQSLLNSIDGSGSLTEMVANAQAQANNIVNLANGEIAQFKNDIPKNVIEPFKDISNSINEPLSDVDGILKDVNKYSNIVVWIAVAVLVVVIVICTGMYFFNNCCSRCVASCFCCISLALLLLIGIPSVVFSILYVVLQDVCPVVEDSIVEFVPSAFPAYTDLKNALMCPKTLPEKDLFSLLGLNESFDYTSIIGDLKNQAQSQISSITPSDSLKQQLEEATKLNPASNINLDHIFSVDMTSIKDRLNELEASGVCTSLASAIGDFDSAENGLGLVKTGLTNTLTASTDFQPFLEDVPTLVDDVVGSISGIIDVLTTGVEKEIDTGVKSIDCGLTCQIYSPVKNALCVHVVDGSAFWLLSSIFFAFGLVGMSCGMCIRRKMMVTPKVKGDEDSDDICKHSDEESGSGSDFGY